MGVVSDISRKCGLLPDPLALTVSLPPPFWSLGLRQDLYGRHVGWAWAPLGLLFLVFYLHMYVTAIQEIEPMNSRVGERRSKERKGCGRTGKGEHAVIIF